jgi:hypothetical protein
MRRNDQKAVAGHNQTNPQLPSGAERTPQTAMRLGNNPIAAITERKSLTPTAMQN